MMATDSYDVAVGDFSVFWCVFFGLVLLLIVKHVKYHEMID